MPPKSTVNSKRNNKKSTLQTRASSKTADTGSSSGLDPEAEDRFELELCWCIQQLETTLATGKLQEKQAQELGKQLHTLKSNTASLIKKRQIMRNMLGDYREKMAEDERKLSKTVSAVKFINSASTKKKSIFVKKAAGCETQDYNHQIDDAKMEHVLQSTNNAFNNMTDTSFRFNFQMSK